MFCLLECAIVPLFAAALGGVQFSSGINLVEVYATVTNVRGEPVAGLTARDFYVSDDGVEQKVTVFASGDVHLSAVVAIDRSFSMAGKPLALAKAAASAFIRALQPDDEVTVVAIGSGSETLAAAPARDVVGGAWLSLQPWGSTPLYDAALAAIDLVQAGRGRRALLLVSDGDDRGSDTTAAALIERARRSDVLVYPATIGSKRQPVLVELAGVSGGRTVSGRDAKELEAGVIALAAELRTQYLLGYAPPPESRRSGWHAIDVRVDRPGVRVRARDGYVAR